MESSDSELATKADSAEMKAFMANLKAQMKADMDKSFERFETRMRAGFSQLSGGAGYIHIRYENAVDARLAMIEGRLYDLERRRSQ
jgi:chromosome segregation ATPase